MGKVAKFCPKDGKVCIRMTEPVERSPEWGSNNGEHLLAKGFDMMRVLRKAAVIRSTLTSPSTQLEDGASCVADGSCVRYGMYSDCEALLVSTVLSISPVLCNWRPSSETDQAAGTKALALVF